jgi:hypothetical protein
MLNVKATAFKIVCLLAGLSSGVGASYLLVEKGLKLPAGILGLFVVVCLFLGAINGDDYQNLWVGQENSWFPGNPFHAKNPSQTNTK